MGRAARVSTAAVAVAVVAAGFGYVHGRGDGDSQFQSSVSAADLAATRAWAPQLLQLVADVDGAMQPVQASLDDLRTAPATASAFVAHDLLVGAGTVDDLSRVAGGLTAADVPTALHLHAQQAVDAVRSLQTALRTAAASVAKGDPTRSVGALQGSLGRDVATAESGVHEAFLRLATDVGLPAPPVAGPRGGYPAGDGFPALPSVVTHGRWLRAAGSACGAVTTVNASASQMLGAGTLDPETYVRQVSQAFRAVPAAVAAVPAPVGAPSGAVLAPVTRLADSLDAAAAALHAQDRTALDVAVARVQADYAALPAEALQAYGSGTCAAAFASSAAPGHGPAGALDLGGTTRSV